MRKLLKRVFQYKRMLLWLCLPLSFLLVCFARLDNNWVEKLFVPYIYKPLSAVIGNFTSLFPFSLTELVFCLAVIGIILYIVYFVRLLIKEKSKWKHHLYRLFVNTVSILSVGILLFQLTMGLNYYRFEIKDYLGLEIKERPVTELYNLCDKLISDLNLYRKELKKDENGITLLSDTDRYETSLSAVKAYKSLSDKIPVLKSANIRNKPLVSSKLFSSVLTTGIYIPIVFESNINVDVPEFTIPATMCHELTHFRGFMRENEANFLGYLACMESDRNDFKYSGTLMAFGYCFSALYNEDEDLAKSLRQKLDSGVIEDVLYEDEYWAPYRNTVVADVSGTVYEEYLQSNNQQSGLKSYGEMVDLMLAYNNK